MTFWIVIFFAGVEAHRAPADNQTMRSCLMQADAMELAMRTTAPDFAHAVSTDVVCLAEREVPTG